MLLQKANRGELFGSIVQLLVCFHSTVIEESHYSVRISGDREGSCPSGTNHSDSVKRQIRTAALTLATNAYLLLSPLATA